MGKATGNPRGRPQGSTTKQTLDVKELAQDYTAEAIERLASIMRNDDAPHAAQVSAVKELLDRAHGKPKQAIDVAADISAHLPDKDVTITLVRPGASPVT